MCNIKNYETLKVIKKKENNLLAPTLGGKYF